MTRLANICTNLTILHLCWMDDLSKTGILSMVSLLRKIIQNNPLITVLHMERFCDNNDFDENIGELVLEILLSSSIDSIIDLDLGYN